MLADMKVLGVFESPDGGVRVEIVQPAPRRQWCLIVYRGVRDPRLFDVSSMQVYLAVELRVPFASLREAA